MCTRAQRAHLALNLKKKILRSLFSKFVVTKESFIVASNVVPILYINAANVCGRDYSNLSHLKKIVIRLQDRAFKSCNQ